jgi:hypothetical protein
MVDVQPRLRSAEVDVEPARIVTESAADQGRRLEQAFDGSALPMENLPLQHIVL